jgi:hypothetical protein
MNKRDCKTRYPPKNGDQDNISCPEKKGAWQNSTVQINKKTILNTKNN